MRDWVGKHWGNMGKQGEYNFPLAIVGNSKEHQGTVKFANILENIVISPRGKDPPPQKFEKLFFCGTVLKKSQPVVEVPFTWSTMLKILGVKFTADTEWLIQLNISDIISMVKILMSTCKSRALTPLGRIIMIPYEVRVGC